ncbi:hypothetical protein ACX8Z9_14545 [Arthrobacter halodurans]|uniref:Uncharacterized protein n=1 Tax=Arthrobacter halodurans TaxID=516699 RepID=A0ABV4UKV2_9MICC
MKHGMGAGKRFAWLLILLVVGFLLCFLLGMWMTDGNWKSVLVISTGPALGALGGVAIRYWWKGREPKRDTFRCRVRTVDGSLPPLTAKWTLGLATVRAGRLEFQPRAGLLGPDAGDVIRIAIDGPARERVPTWTEILFRLPPLWRIVSFESGGGRVEVAAGRAGSRAAGASVGVASQH